MFSPGETVQHKFVIPFAAREVSKVVVTYKQMDHVVLIKEITSDITPTTDDQGQERATECQFDYVLTQEESLLFDEKRDFLIQLNVYTTSGSRAASCEIKGSNGVQHYKEVIRNE